MDRFFTAFDEYVIGVTPDDWTIEWESASWTVEAITIPDERIVLQGNGLTGNYALSWDAVGVVTDAEIVFPVQVPGISSSNRMRGIIRGGGSSAAPIGYFCEISGAAVDSFNIWIVNAGTFTNLATTPIVYTDDTWYWIRFRVLGTDLFAKFWADGDPEPGAWTLTASNATLASGWTGISTRTATYIDLFGVSVDPATIGAPMEAFTTGLHAVTVLETETVASIGQIHDLEAETILELETKATLHPTLLEALTIIETAAEAAETQQDHALRAETYIETYTEAALAGEHNLRALTAIELYANDNYSGPGTGLLTGDPALTDIHDIVNSLREGDISQILSSWAGVDGISGLVRVLKRSAIDASQHQTISEPYFIPLPDPSLPLRQRGGSRIKTIPERTIFRQVRDQQRRLDQDG